MKSKNLAMGFWTKEERTTSRGQFSVPAPEERAPILREHRGKGGKRLGKVIGGGEIFPPENGSFPGGERA